MNNARSISVREHAVTPGCARYVWQAPGKPLAVHLSLDVVERMEREVIESFKAITQRGSEIGGLLLGKLPSNQPALIVEDYEKVPCDYARGPLYLLAEPDKARLEAALARFRAGGEQGRVVVGFFRSNTRKDLALDEEDLALMHQYFAEARQVCLLVRPFSMKPSLGGFFLWEAGRMEGDASYREFPFRRSELMKGDFAKAVVGDGESPVAAGPGKVDGSPASAATAEVRVSIPLVVPKREEPAAPQPEARASVSPVIPKREAPAPPPPPPLPAAKLQARTSIPVVIPKREPPAPSPPPVVKPEVRLSGAPVSPKREVAPPPPAKPPARSAVTSLGLAWEPVQPPSPETRAAAPTVTPKREEAVPLVPPKPEAVPSPSSPTAQCEEPAPPTVARAEEPAATALAPERRRRTLAFAVAAVATVMVIGAGSLLLFRPGGGRIPAPAAVPDASSLALRVERNAGQLLLSWNREATIVKNARTAVLSIFDGEHKEDVKLDPGQLRSGSIVYAPTTNDVSFKLEVGDAKGQSQSESVRAIAGRPSPAAPLGQAVPTRPENATTDARVGQEPPAGQTPQPGRASSADTSPTPGGGVEPPAPSQPNARTSAPFRTESLAARLSPPPNLPEPPRLEVQTGAAIVRPIQTQGALPPPPAQEPRPAGPQPASAAAQEPGALASGQPLRVGGNVQQALLVRQVMPTYPPLARQARVSGVVRVEATIGRDGKIVKVEAISGPPLLRQAAQDAVRQWIYKPTTLNGQPVEVVTQVDVTFNLNR